MGIEYLLLVGCSLMSGASTYFQKKYTQRTGNGGLTASLLFIFGSAVLSMLSFWLMAGGKLVFNNTILLFAIISGLIYNAANLINLFAYRNVNLVLISVFGKASTVTTWLFGVLLFNETPSPTNLASIALIIASVFLPIADFKNSPGRLRLTYIIGLTQLIISTANTLTLKCFLALPSSDANATSSLLFFSCAFMTIPPIIIMLVRTKKNRALVRSEFSFIPFFAFMCIILTNLFGNPTSLVSSLVMKRMPLMNYSILTSAFGSMVVFLSSRLIFKERPGKTTIFALVLSTLAAIINTL